MAKGNTSVDQLLALLFACLSLLLPLLFYLNLGGTFSLALFGGVILGTLGFGFAYRCRQQNDIASYRH